MDLTRYVDDLRHQVLAAAEFGGDDVRTLADRLMAPVEAATRLVLLDVLSDAADEITSELAPGSVEVRLRQGDPEFVVTAPPTGLPSGPDDAAADRDVTVTAPVPPATDAEEGGTARVTLRLPEPTKARIEQAAADAGLSVNAWLVRVTTEALGDAARPQPTRRRGLGGDHVTGWVR